MVIQIDVHPNDLKQVVGSVFSAMMGIHVQPVELGSEWRLPAGVLIATVRMAGSWDGAVLIHCLPRQACRFAGSFLGMPPPQTVNEDVRDVLGEVANMIAGNLKCALHPGIRISIPIVGEAAGAIPGVTAYRSEFETPQGPFWLSVVGI